MNSFLIGLYVGGCLGYGLKVFALMYGNMSQLKKEHSPGVLWFALITETMLCFIIWPYYLTQDIIRLIPTKEVK